MATILIALGANLGDRGETVTQAIDQLAADPDFTRIAQSSLLVTKPVGGPAGQPDFINAAAKYETSLSPEQVHQKLIEIEHQHGRVRNLRWGARSLDLDLLLYDTEIRQTPRLTLPHPRMSFRRFVMQPAAEIAAEMFHPQLGATIGQLWQQLANSPPVVEIASPPGPTTWRLCAEVQHKLGQQVVFTPPAEAWPESVDQLPSLLDRSLRQAATAWGPPPGYAVSLLPWWSKLPDVLSGTSAPGASLPTLPRLVILWLPAPESVDEIERAWWPPEARDALEQRLREAVQQNVHGPLLCLAGHDMTAAITEVTAAVEAIQ
ncbi:2-amino-4-hydroxy-6-hydroxymethyldihydropteridine diphosphokinase [Bremerella cremea]|uniref:2-amino-4-hydroxy-6-hydroxymethyldihydropteridine pyrophosphokinase n=1 Tax=Bremerella cremea TaxID=1031537 RepID=A0A368KXV1_9BACT|nr:2-amino-4-hydroxy-6-hydroxymethyldihydropteridine diphosphokinase [Bremerella cremea]RCS56168.1 2-amino-4-hydroxy-6-hydroxymethyldihydropteridine diphosphokinase [Bremerella cremea]